MNTFINAVKSTPTTLTENGALAFDKNFAYDAVFQLFATGGALRNTSAKDIRALYELAFQENPTLAARAMMYIRDIPSRSNGLGEREATRIGLRMLCKESPKIAEQVLPLIPHYGRWDDIFVAIGTPMQPLMLEMVINQLENDASAIGYTELGSDFTVSDPTISISTLGKWLPNENTSSALTKNMARELIKELCITHREYRKLRVALIKQLNVVEQLMSANQWESINFTHVPARANFIYRRAFNRHQPIRYQAHIKAVLSGESTMNSANLFPHEIVGTYKGHSKINNSLEAMWESLPNIFGENEPRNILPVIDTSASMNCPLMQPAVAINGRMTYKRTSFDCMDVSIALGMLLAQHNTGPFHNLGITFSSNPAFVNISGKTLKDRIAKVKRMPWGGTTNLMGTFRLILNMCVIHAVAQSDLPEIVIISDMQFDNAFTRGQNNTTIFRQAKQEFANAGYELPNVHFINCNSRDGMPVSQHETGAALYSGFSSGILSSILSGQEIEVLTPEAAMLEILNSERYAGINIT